MDCFLLIRDGVGHVMPSELLARQDIAMGQQIVLAKLRDAQGRHLHGRRQIEPQATHLKRRGDHIVEA